MFASIIALISAVCVAVLTQIIMYIRERKTHEEERMDKKEDQHDEIIQSLRELKQGQKLLEEKILENEMKEARIRILRFQDEILNGESHTLSHFRQTLLDLDVYERYTEAHPNFKNGYTKHAVVYIKKVYEKLEEEGGFLTEENSKRGVIE